VACGKGPLKSVGSRQNVERSTSQPHVGTGPCWASVYGRILVVTEATSVREAMFEQSWGGRGGGGRGGGGVGGGGDGGGGDGGGGEDGGGGSGGGDGGGEGSAQNALLSGEKPAKRKLRPVVQHAVMKKRTWKWSVLSIIAITDRRFCRSVSEK
jgi:hypothetical protein